VAHGLLWSGTMKLFAASAFVLLTLCGPALADSASPARPDSLQVHFSLHDAAATRIFDVIVSPDHPCATVSETLPNHGIEIKACVTRDAHLDVEWSTHSSSGEYRSTSSLALAHGATAELGAANGPRLGVAIQ
jgi:hypothetical protein